jgi:hypothetical protein
MRKIFSFCREREKETRREREEIITIYKERKMEIKKKKFFLYPFSFFSW